MNRPDFEARSYAGGLFDEEAPAGRVTGRVRVETAALVFEAEGRHLRLPLRGLEVSRGGTRHRMIFFDHPELAGGRVWTTDRSILGDPSLEADPELAAQLHSLRRAAWGRRGKTLAGLAAAALAVWGVLLLKGLLVSYATGKVPASIERKMGEAAFEEITRRSALLERPDAKRLLAQIAAPLTEAVRELGDAPPAGFHFHLVRDPSINAFALPGGIIVVHTGLVEAADHPGQLAGVLAHEIAHVTRRHGLRAVMDRLSNTLLLALLIGDTEGLHAALLTRSAGLLDLAHSRELELEADALAHTYLRAAEIDPRGLVAFFRLLAERARTTSAPAFLRTHPVPETRIEALEKRLETSPAGRRVRSRDRSLLNALKKVIMNTPDGPHAMLSSEGG